MDRSINARAPFVDAWSRLSSAVMRDSARLRCGRSLQSPANRLRQRLRRGLFGSARQQVVHQGNAKRGASVRSVHGSHLPLQKNEQALERQSAGVGQRRRRITEDVKTSVSTNHWSYKRWGVCAFTMSSYLSVAATLCAIFRERYSVLIAASEISKGRGPVVRLL